MKEDETTKSESASQIASLQSDLSKRSFESAALSAKLASDEAALKTTGDSGAKAQALAADLEKARGDLASTRGQLAQALKGGEDARADASSRAAALEQANARLSGENGALQDKLVKAEEAGLAARVAAERTSGDAGAKAQALAAELEKTNHDLDTAHGLLAQALRNSQAAKAQYEAEDAAKSAELASARQAAEAASASADGAAKAQALAAQLDQAKIQSMDLQSRLQKAEGEIAELQPLLLKARHMPVTTSLEKVHGGRSFTLHINNLNVQPLSVNVSITGPDKARSQTNIIGASATLNVEKLAPGETVVIASDGFDPVTLTAE